MIDTCVRCGAEIRYTTDLDGQTVACGTCGLEHEIKVDSWLEPPDDWKTRPDLRAGRHPREEERT